MKNNKNQLNSKISQQKSNNEHKELKSQIHNSLNLTLSKSKNKDKTYEKSPKSSKSSLIKEESIKSKNISKSHNKNKITIIKNYEDLKKISYQKITSIKNNNQSIKANKHNKNIEQLLPKNSNFENNKKLKNENNKQITTIINIYNNSYKQKPKQIFIKEDNLNEYDINKKLVDKFEERKKRNSMSQFSNKYHKNNVKIKSQSQEKPHNNFNDSDYNENKADINMKMIKSASIIDFNIDNLRNHSIIQSKKESKKLSSLHLKKINLIHQVTKTGISLQKRINQDSNFIFEDFEGEKENLFLGICDGHGKYGHLISQSISENLPNLLNSTIIKFKMNNKITSIEYRNIISDIFEKMNEILYENFGHKLELSGSTCTGILFSPERIFSVNIGDSRCVIGKFIDNEWKAQNLTRDHKPSEKDEMERIINCGGRIEQIRDEKGNYIGPYRVWTKDSNTIGLGMSRSFGDILANKIGIICKPEIMEWYFSEEDKFIIIASDGLWEYLSSQEVVDLLKTYYLKGEIKEAAERIVLIASNRWKKNEGVVDDISIILIYFNE